MRKPRLEKLPVIIGSPQLQDGTLEVISPSRTRKEKALVDKNYDLDPGLQLLMNNDHYTFYRPHIRSGSTTATSFGLNRKSSVPLTNLSKLENNPLIQSRTHVPKYFKFEYTEPQHKSREASQNHSTTNISKLLNNNTTTNLNLISKEILSRDFSSVTPSPHPTQQAKKMVKFMERSSSIENLKSEATSEISRIVRGRKFDIIETNESVEEIIGSDKLRAKLEELKTIGI